MPQGYDQNLGFHIDGTWRHAGGDGRTRSVLDPATGKEIARLPVAAPSDLDDALAAAARAFPAWRALTAAKRQQVLDRWAALVRDQAEAIAPILTREQGKTLAEARDEIAKCADVLEWFGEEGRRSYGRSIPTRQPGTRWQVEFEPVGPVAAFTPWNYPASQAIRKVAAALAAGCSVVLKSAEEAPGSVVALVRLGAQAGLPAGVLNLVFGEPAEISAHLIASPVIRKVSFTGSVPVGRLLAQQAAAHLKPITLELGGHSPVIVFPDADLDRTVKTLVRFKFGNAGQMCVSPSRFYLHADIYDRFAAAFAAQAAGIRVGNGLDPASQMGPVANERRLKAVLGLVDEAVAAGAKVLSGGHRIGDAGFFIAPTVLENVPADARLLHEEPFGPVAPLIRFEDEAAVLAEANGLPYGLAAYAFTASARRAEQVAAAFDSGLVGINAVGLGAIETPFGGVKDSGYGREGGAEGLAAYQVGKFIAHSAWS